MNGLLLKPAITAAGGSLLCSNPTAAQVLPPAKRAVRVDITKGPALELARDDLPLSDGPPTTSGGPPVRYAVVHYVTDRDDLSQMRKITSG